ncbi:MAG: MATE family efflux transporter, partial [Muribaculaceae bacterium]|nr:MATE family efflux transporter [Muribaculaceae bacterium]
YHQQFISPDGEAAGVASDHFRIGVWWVPAQLTIMAVSGWFIGLQTTIVPMTIAITTNIINIISSIFLAFALRMGFEGIAYGTLSANWIGAAIAVGWGYSRLRKMEREIEVKNEGSPSGTPSEKGKIKWSEFFSVNAALFIRSSCIMAVTLTVTSVGARLGELTLAANAVIMQFFFFFSYFMDGFAFSGEALAGRFSGAGKRDMVIRTMRRLCVWGGVMALLFFSIYYFGSGRIASLITDTESVVREISRYRLWILLLPPVTVAAFIFDGLFVGLTKTRDMMWVTIAGAGVFFMLLFLSGLTLNNNLLWFAFEAYLFIRGGALALIFINKFAKKKAY